MRRLVLLALATLAAACASSCSVMSIEEGADPARGALRAPETATLAPEGGATCITPCDLDLGSLPEEFELRINVDGFLPGRVTIRHRGDAWHADLVDLGSSPTLAIDTVRGTVSRAWLDEFQSGGGAAAVLGSGQVGHLYAAVVTETDVAQPVVLHLTRE